MKKPILIVVGTRPDAIKLIPVYKTLKEQGMPVVLCATFQHNHLLKQVFDIFNITPDIALNVMQPKQDLFYLTTALLNQLKIVIESINPFYVIVQGDTTSSFCAALAAFYNKIPIAHVEAGLRTGNLYSPFPEEANRKIISTLATLHFAPTDTNKQSLLHENIDPSYIFTVGNTGIDSLLWIEKQLTSHALTPSDFIQSFIKKEETAKRKIILLTVHRRESFGETLINIFSGIAAFLATHDDITIIYPTHPNPEVQKALHTSALASAKNITIIDAVAYHDLVSLLLACHWVMTDSGGIQEEATSLGKPTIILRQNTERQEAIINGIANLGGTDSNSIQNAMFKLYDAKTISLPRSTIYGDGTASKKIAAEIKKYEIVNKAVFTPQCL